jgi:hypothetical protein
MKSQQYRRGGIKEHFADTECDQANLQTYHLESLDHSDYDFIILLRKWMYVRRLMRFVVLCIIVDTRLAVDRSPVRASFTEFPIFLCQLILH